MSGTSIFDDFSQQEVGAVSGSLRMMLSNSNASVLSLARFLVEIDLPMGGSGSEHPFVINTRAVEQERTSTELSGPTENLSTDLASAVSRFDFVDLCVNVRVATLNTSWSGICPVHVSIWNHREAGALEVTCIGDVFWSTDYLNSQEYSNWRSDPGWTRVLQARSAWVREFGQSAWSSTNSILCGHRFEESCFSHFVLSSTEFARVSGLASVSAGKWWASSEIDGGWLFMDSPYIEAIVSPLVVSDREYASSLLGDFPLVLNARDFLRAEMGGQ